MPCAHGCYLTIAVAPPGTPPARAMSTDQSDWDFGPSSTADPASTGCASGSLKSAQQTASSQNRHAAGTAGTADGDILQQLMRDMYSSDESKESMSGHFTGSQQEAASRTPSEPASMSTSHHSDTESCSSDEGIENSYQAQPDIGAHAEGSAFKAGTSFPASQPAAAAANGRQPPVFAFSQVSCSVSMSSFRPNDTYADLMVMLCSALLS